MHFRALPNWIAHALQGSWENAADGVLFIDVPAACFFQGIGFQHSLFEDFFKETINQRFRKPRDKNFGNQWY